MLGLQGLAFKVPLARRVTTAQPASECRVHKDPVEKRVTRANAASKVKLAIPGQRVSVFKAQSAPKAWLANPSLGRKESPELLGSDCKVRVAPKAM
jgi:hypothetical protein